MKVDDNFLARAIRVSFELSSLVAGGLEASGAAEELETAVHDLWVESGRADKATRDLCLWAEAQGEIFEV